MVDRDPLIAVTAALAAAISLLERTPKAKKAAASDKMFDQMLKDYRKALDTGRAALQTSGTKAQVEIRLWSDDKSVLPDDLPAAFQPHAEHVAALLAQGYVAGEVVDERFRGWWEIVKS
jgi:hypothetical protein